MTPPPVTPPRPRLMRRSRSDRIGAGVAGGLGEYFGVDPVLFRVLFATAAFFGGAGILAYLVAWAAIPEDGTEHAPIDGWVRSLRARRVPFWLIVAGALVLLWLVAFSWWAPGPFLPVIVVVIILVAVFGRRGRRPSPEVPPAPVSLEKDVPLDGRARWTDEARHWIAESHAASKARARRAFPVKIATLLTLVAALVTLGLVDGAKGIAVPVYFWFALAIVGVGLLVGMTLRRTPWGMTPLFVLAGAGAIAFAGSHASLHDGVGRRDWTPTNSLATHYDLAFGQATLDLRSLQNVPADKVIRIDQAAGHIRIVAPRSMKLTVHADVHFGSVTLDDDLPDGAAGVGVTRTIEPLATATGPALTIDVHLADGQIAVSRV